MGMESTILPYDIEHVIGQGSTCEVLLGKVQSPDIQRRTPVVIKRMAKATTPKSMLLNEVEASKRFDHPNIAKFHAHYEDTDYDYLVFDFVHGCDLFAFLEKREFAPMPEHDARAVFVRIVTAVKYAHDKGVAHRDLKLENILIDEENNVKIIDFGLSTIDKPDGETNLCSDWVGTPEYCCPEILLRIPYSARAADVWALGNILYTLLYMTLPFDPEDRFKKLQSGEPHPEVQFPATRELSDDAKDLMGKMLNPDQSGRITLDEVLRHTWFDPCHISA